jgi:hypothetical protein
MYGKFYHLSIIGNFPTTIRFIPTRNDEEMKWWNNGIIAFHAIICQYLQQEKKLFLSAFTIKTISVADYHQTWRQHEHF